MGRKEEIEAAGATHAMYKTSVGNAIDIQAQKDFIAGALWADAHQKQKEIVYICILDYSIGSISAIKTSWQEDYSDYEDVMIKHGFKPSLCEWTILDEKPVINFIEDKDE